jgi:hypothetical protein
MIEQCLSNKNKNATLSKSKKKRSKQGLSENTGIQQLYSSKL